MEKEMKRSKYWNELVEVLEQEFPKGECKERGGALVLLSYAEMALQKQKAELEKAVREEERNKEKWLISFVEYATYVEGKQGGRIDIVPFHGDIERDKFEIGTITLPIEEWQYLRKMHDGKIISLKQ